MAEAKNKPMVSVLSQNMIFEMKIYKAGTPLDDIPAQLAQIAKQRKLVKRVEEKKSGKGA